MKMVDDHMKKSTKTVSQKSKYEKESTKKSAKVNSSMYGDGQNNESSTRTN